MSDNKRFLSSGKGYYIALILCAAAIGITGYVYYRNAGEAQEVSQVETYADVLVGTLGTEDVPVLSTQPQPTAPRETGKENPEQKSGSSAPSESQTTPPATEKRVLKTMSPVAGEQIFGYSMEALSYNQTTRDWRVHNGIDLAAEDGAQVAAAADGEVYTVYEDNTLGHTVVIRHAEGYTTRYASLTEDVAVKPGDTVTMGQVIGCAGDSALVECSLGSHVHFSVTRYDEPMDPAEFLSLGQ